MAKKRTRTQTCSSKATLLVGPHRLPNLGCLGCFYMFVFLTHKRRPTYPITTETHMLQSICTSQSSPINGSARIPNQIPNQDSTQSSGSKAAVEPGVTMWLVVTVDG